MMLLMHFLADGLFILVLITVSFMLLSAGYDSCNVENLLVTRI